MYTTGPVVRSFNRGGRLQLNVMINSLCDDNSTLAWYHNKTHITSGSKFTITDDDTVLTGINMESSDAGVYEVRISSVNVTCEPPSSCVLPLPETLAVYAPVTFIVQENCLPTYNPLHVVSVKYIFENDDESSRAIELRSTAHTINNSSYVWYRNGLKG